ncbi:MAG: hypothetical protein V3U29_05535 [Phycisphaeraceae bacterium]
MRLTIQVVASAALVMAVLWGMWRLPRRGEALFDWAPPMALISPWAGVLALVTSVLLWVLPYPDRWVSLTFLLLDPGAIATGVLVLWIYRGRVHTSPTIDSQCLQAKVGIALGMLAIVAGYLYVMWSKSPGTAVGT